MRRIRGTKADRIEKMLIQFVSDLHIDAWGHGIPRPLPFGPKDVVGDVLVVAGDVDEGIMSLLTYLKILTEAGKPVLFVPGNHDFFSGTWTTYPERLSKALPSGVTLLNCTEMALQGVRFLGCTLWTNFGGSTRKMRDCESGMPDYEEIVKDRDAWTMITGEDVLQRHVEELAWLEGRLAEPFDGPTVVVTHHAPSVRSNHPKFMGSRIGTAFYSRLEWLIEKTQPDLWIHGHMHNSSDYRIGKTRVVCNPCGYSEGENPEWEAQKFAIVGENE